MKPKLAIFELHHLGDAVMAIPFLRGARATYEPVVFCTPSVSHFLKMAQPELSTKVLSNSWVSRMGEVREAAKHHPFAAAACVWPDVRAHQLMALTKAPTRAGFVVEAHNFYAAEIPWRKRRLMAGRALNKALGILHRSPLLTHPLRKTDSKQHHGRSWQQLAEALGFEIDVSVPWINPEPFSNALPELDHLPRPVFMLHGGGRLPTKRWNGFQEVLKSFFAPAGLSVVIIAPPDEPHPTPQGPNQIVVPTPDLKTLLEIASRADACLANDSFAAHLVAAFGKPVVTVFGSGEPDWFAPFANRHRVVATDACPSHPCIDRCTMPSYVCLESVTQRQVATALQDLLHELQINP